MIGLLLAQLLAIGVCALLYGVPGWAISRIVQLHLRVPTVLLPVVYFTLGLGVWTLVLLPALTFGWSIRWSVLAQVSVTLGLIVLVRVRERRRSHAKQGSDAFSAWTLAAIAIAGLMALGLRTRLAFDSLFHLGLSRRLLELPHPTFDNLDRIIGAGVNPAYALPSWQAAIAAIAAVSGQDPATVLEAMAVIGVLLAACAAAAFGRVVTGVVAGEIAGVAAYVWLRVVFPRRELEGDGVAYAALPGNIALDVLLPLALVVAVLLVRSRIGAGRERALGMLGGVAVVLLVVLHANYIVYLAIIAAGTIGWLVATGPWSAAIARRVGTATAWLAFPGALALAALLPVLMLLEHFGAPREARIDYHLISVGGIELIRPGHLYDWFAVPGLLGMLLLPWAAWRARGIGRALIGGGSLALLAFALVPTLVDVLGASGSLTLSLRLPRPVGVLLIAAFAVAVPDLVARVAGLAVLTRVRRGQAGAWAVGIAAIGSITALALAYGYPMARKDPPDYGWNWPTIVALIALLVVLGIGVARRRAPGGGLEAGPASPPVSTATLGITMLLIGLAISTSGWRSTRRAAWQAREIVAAYRADDLRCFDGIQATLRDLPAGSVLLADPVTGYGAQALAPALLAADFKTWNGSTDSATIDRRIQLLNAMYGSTKQRRSGAALARLAEDLDARYVLVAGGEVEPPIGSPLPSYDAIGLRDLLESGTISAKRIASGNGRFPSDADPAEVAACELSLWQLDGSERALELRRLANGDIA